MGKGKPQARRKGAASVASGGAVMGAASCCREGGGLGARTSIYAGFERVQLIPGRAGFISCGSAASRKAAAGAVLARFLSTEGVPMGQEKGSQRVSMRAPAVFSLQFHWATPLASRRKASGCTPPAASPPVAPYRPGRPSPAGWACESAHRVRGRPGRPAQCA